MSAPANPDAAQTELNYPESLQITVVLDNIRSAFNVGSIFRTSDAAAVHELKLCGMTPYPPNPRLIRAALSAEKSVSWEVCPTTTSAVEALKAEQIPVIALENTPAALPYTEFDWPDRFALVVGHEVRGIRQDVVDLCDYCVEIPMFGKKNTLNVATAYGVVLYEILRQKIRKND